MKKGARTGGAQQAGVSGNAHKAKGQSKNVQSDETKDENIRRLSQELEVLKRKLAASVRDSPQVTKGQGGLKRAKVCSDSPGATDNAGSRAHYSASPGYAQRFAEDPPQYPSSSALRGDRTGVATAQQWKVQLVGSHTASTSTHTHTP